RHAIRNWDPNGADAQFLSNFLDRWDKIARQRELMAGWSTWLELLRTYRKLKERRERMQMHASFFGLLREHAPGARRERRRVDGHAWVNYTGVFGDIGREAKKLLCQNMRLRTTPSMLQDARLLLGKSRKVPLRRAVYGAEEVRAPAPAPAAAVEEARAPPPGQRREARARARLAGVEGAVAVLDDADVGGADVGVDDAMLALRRGGPLEAAAPSRLESAAPARPRPPAPRRRRPRASKKAKKKARAVHEALPPPRDDESSLASYATPVDGDELEHLALDWDVLGQPMKDVHPGTGLGEAALLRNVDAADSTGERCANYGNSAACAAPCVVVSVPAEVYAAALRPRHLELVEHLAKVEFLRSIPVFGRWPPERVGQLAAACAVVELATGEVACRRGDKVGRLCFVRRGELGLSARLDGALPGATKTAPSKTAELSRCGPGCCLGDLEVLEGLPTYLCTARAAMTTVVYAVARRDFERCVLHNPHSQGTKQTVAALRRAVEARKDFHAYRALVELQRLTGQKGLGALDAPAEHPYVCSEFEAALASKIEATFERVWDRSPAEALSKARTALALR
ncbi:hypothetical protein SO694_00118090, partial [Aureococcus anophagefferens]